MSLDAKRSQAKEIILLLKKEYPHAKVALDFSNPWELLVATVLSAQATDKKVNQVTKELFKKYPTIRDYADASLHQFQEDIKTIGLYRNKAKYIVSAAKTIVDKYNSRVPYTIDEILTLPGVARKTANIVLGNAYGVVEGIAVDTHVKRISARLGFSKEKDPDKIEKDLMQLFAREDWFSVNYLLINHGRAVCRAKNPLCEKCALNKICPSAFAFPQYI